MRTATALTVVAVGAILAFAVTAEPPGFSFHVAGWVLMITGVAGAALPRRGYSWLRRHVVLSGGDRRVRIPEDAAHASGRLPETSGVTTEPQADARTELPVEKEIIEEVREE